MLRIWRNPWKYVPINGSDKSHDKNWHTILYGIEDSVTFINSV